MTDRHFTILHTSIGCSQLMLVGQNRLSHVHGHFDYLIVGISRHMEQFRAGKCVDGQFFFRRDPIIVEILAHAANAVATHFSFRTVIVEDAHRKVTAFVLPDEYNAVAADAFVPIAPSYGKFFGVGYWEAHGVNVNVIVSGAMHFCKFYSLSHFYGNTIFVRLIAAKLR